MNKKEKNTSPKTGYLVKSSWINKWKKITYYQKIKILIKLKCNNDLISNEVINHLEKNKLKYKDLPPLEIFNYKNKKELDDVLLNDSLVIIDTNLKQSLDNTSKGNFVIYNLYNNEIHLNNDERMAYHIYKNIIITKKNLNLFFLNQLFKIIKFNPESNSIYLINKNILNHFKNIFYFDRIKQLLANNSISINTNNFKEYFYNIKQIIKMIRNIWIN